MKKAILLIVLMLVCSVARATDYCASAVGCWLFTEGSGTVADSSPNSNTGTLENGASWSTTTPPSATYITKSVFLDNATWNYNDRVNLGTDSSLDLTGNFTVVSWIRTASVSTQQQIYSRGAWKSGGIYFQLYQSKLTISTNQSGAWQETQSDVNPVSADTFAHVAAVLSSGTSYLYKDGDQTTYSEHPSHTNPSSYSGTAYIGYYSAGSLQGFIGYITETAVFSSALNSTQINDIMDNGLSPSAPSSHMNIIRNAVIRNAILR